MSRLLSAAAVAALATFLVPALAGAQPYGPPPGPPPGGPGYGGGGYYMPPPPPLVRQGLAIGFGFGLGGMNSQSGAGDCQDCNGNPAAVGIDFHIGGMINPNLALLLEIWGTGRQLDAAGFATLTQTMLLGAVQYWLTPMFWLKGGLGFSSLNISYNDGGPDDNVDSGTGVMGAAGFEVLHSPLFAIDLQLRLGVGTYHGVDDKISTGMFGVGFNWY
jgi:hypothetical protein